MLSAPLFRRYLVRTWLVRPTIPPRARCLRLLGLIPPIAAWQVGNRVERGRRHPPGALAARVGQEQERRGHARGKRHDDARDTQTAREPRAVNGPRAAERDAGEATRVLAPAD